MEKKESSAGRMVLGTLFSTKTPPCLLSLYVAFLTH
jgi:hypothetical protein